MGRGGWVQERTRTRMPFLRGLRARKTSGSGSWIFYTERSWQKTAKIATPRAIVRYASGVGLFNFPNRAILLLYQVSFDTGHTFAYISTASDSAKALPRWTRRAQTTRVRRKVRARARRMRTTRKNTARAMVTRRISQKRSGVCICVGMCACVCL